MLKACWALVLALAGCAQVPQQPLDKKEAASISSIALLEAPEPDKFVVFEGGAGFVMMNTVGAVVPVVFLLGALSAVADVERSNTLSGTFTDAMHAQGVRLGGPLTEALREALERRGFKVERLAGQRPAADYSNIKTDSDAILDVRFSSHPGYLTVVNADFTQSVNISARLVASRTRQSIYYQQFSYSPNTLGIAGGVKRVAGAETAFSSFEALMKDFARARDGITAAIVPLAEAVASDLR